MAARRTEGRDLAMALLPQGESARVDAQVVWRIRLLVAELIVLGFVLTLWFGTHSGIAAFLAGALCMHSVVLISHDRG